MNWMSKRGARVPEDRISALPKALICHILSFVPTLDAVRTTVLSKTWNNIWTSVTSLDFNDHRDDTRFKYGSLWGHDGLSRFTNFVNCVLLFSDSSDIQKFQLSVQYSSKDCVENWLRTAVRRNVVELHIRFPWGNKEFVIPACVFKCKTLRALRLELYYNPLPREYPSSGSECFPKLKFLHVTFEYPESNFLGNLISCCPVLEDLIIDGIADILDHRFNLSAPQLKSLTISLIHISYIHINAPKLEKLVLNRVTVPNYNLENAKSLVSACISFDDISAQEFPSVSTRVTALLAGISNVKYLSLSTYTFEVSYLPAFINLKKLDLLLHERNYWEVLPELLYRAPNLEDMVLEDKTESYNEYCSELPWNPPETLPNCLLSHLKTITIKGFKGLRGEMDLAKYVLNNGYVLKKMTLYTGSTLYTDAEEMYKEFLMFHRAMSCQVKFIKMGFGLY